MSQSVSSPLLIEGDTARVVSPDRLVRIGDLPGLREVRRLAVPAHVETLFGLERFQHRSCGTTAAPTCWGSGSCWTG